MYDALIITPVKNSIETTIKTIKSIKSSNGNFLYYIYNDFSTKDNTVRLKEICNNYQIHLINLEDYTRNPSPNYRLVLQMAQKKALESNLPLIIVESDVIVRNNTINELLALEAKLEKAGLIGCITHDETENVNFPYSKLKKQNAPIINTRHSVSFCCTLISINLLKVYDFTRLSANKDWYDISISKKSLRLGFNNYLTTQNSVLHAPHSSRPWKLIKYKNPIKYYLVKIFNRLDRI